MESPYCYGKKTSRFSWHYLIVVISGVNDIFKSCMFHNTIYLHCIVGSMYEHLEGVVQNSHIYQFIWWEICRTDFRETCSKLYGVVLENSNKRFIAQTILHHMYIKYDTLFHLFSPWIQAVYGLWYSDGSMFSLTPEISTKWKYEMPSF